MHIKPYKTIRELKEDLPLILDQIKILRELAQIHLHSFELYKSMALLETIDNGYDFGQFTTKEYISKEYKEYLDSVAQADYLESKIKELGKKKL